jgi:hypothetical protein
VLFNFFMTSLRLLTSLTKRSKTGGLLLLVFRRRFILLFSVVISIDFFVSVRRLISSIIRFTTVSVCWLLLRGTWLERDAVRGVNCDFIGGANCGSDIVWCDTEYGFGIDQGFPTGVFYLGTGIPQGPSSSSTYHESTISSVLSATGIEVGSKNL